MWSLMLAIIYQAVGLLTPLVPKLELGAAIALWASWEGQMGSRDLGDWVFLQVCLCP